MFRSKRSALVKRLWKLRVKHEADGQAEEDKHALDEEVEEKAVAQAMLKRLKESQLESLLLALESKGGETTDCVLLPKGDLRLGRRQVAPQLLCCRLFRWRDVLKSDSQLKRLPCCSTLSTDPAYVCCNPHHWSLVMDPDFPPVELTDTLGVDGLSFQRVQKSSGGHLHQQTVSTETGFTPTHYRLDSMDNTSCQYSPISLLEEDQEERNGHEREPTVEGRGIGVEDGSPLHRPTVVLPQGLQDGTKHPRSGPVGGQPHPTIPAGQSSVHWCSIAYWELRQRVGRIYVVREPTINVFQRLPHGGGMCLQLLQSETQVQPIRRTREKIGLGLILSREGRSVWAYNRSQYPLFVNSPTLEPANCRSLVVWKVPPGHSIRLFDYDRTAQLQAARDPALADGPYDPWSVRVSFAKGWGQFYTRQFVTSCPCWLEILLKEVKR